MFLVKNTKLEKKKKVFFPQADHDVNFIWKIVNS